MRSGARVAYGLAQAGTAKAIAPRRGCTAKGRGNSILIAVMRGLGNNPEEYNQTKQKEKERTATTHCSAADAGGGSGSPPPKNRREWPTNCSVPRPCSLCI